jgi:predicted aspartyl protease
MRPSSPGESKENAMGVTQVTVRVSDLVRQGTPFEDEFLADTGAIDCMAPGDRLIGAGIQPEVKSVYELANGESVEYEVGFARIAFAGVETVAPIIFGPRGTQPILGVVALESAGFVVDPVSQELKKVPAKPLK